MRNRLLLALAIMLGLFYTGQTANAQGVLNDVYNGDRLHNYFDPLNGGCTTLWENSTLLEGPAWLAQSRLTLTGPCYGVSEQNVMIKWHHAGAIYIDSIFVWGRSTSLHYYRFYANGTVISTSGFPANEYGLIGLNLWIPGGDIIIEKIGTGYNGYSNDFITSITQVQFNYRLSPPTATPTNTPRNTATPYPSTTSYPTASPVNTFIPTVLPQTRIAPALTPYATVDTCPSDDIRTPCANPFYNFATLAVPTFNLPSPTAIALLPTHTPAPITNTPTVTRSPTASNTPVPTIGPSPTASPDTSILPTLNVTAWNDGSNAIGNAIPSLVPLLGVGFDTGSATPMGIEQAAEKLGAGAGKAIALAKSLELTELNKFGGVVAFLFLLFMFSILVEVIILVLPLLNMLLQWLWRIIKLIPFIE